MPALFSAKRQSPVTLFILFSALTLLNFGPCQQKDKVTKSTNQNKLDDVQVEGNQTAELQLELKSDQMKLGPGDCTNLRLDVFNKLPNPVYQAEGWLLEQEGPSPPLPDGISVTSEIPSGKSPDFIAFYICSSNRVKGIYRFRITAAPKSAVPIHSNWVAIEVLP
jgi:hypothetical protein